MHLDVGQVDVMASVNEDSGSRAAPSAHGNDSAGNQGGIIPRGAEQSILKDGYIIGSQANISLTIDNMARFLLKGNSP